MGLWDKLLDRTIYYSFDRSGFLRHQNRFDGGDLDVSMKGKICLVTGGNSGLGLATASSLAERQATVYLLSRNAERGHQAREAVTKNTGNREVYLEVVDLASPDSIRSFADRFELPHVDLLVHNAGLLPLERELTPDGLELTVATHLVGPFLLTWLLQKKLAGGRVIFVASGGMYAKRLDVRAMLDNGGRYDGVAAYAMTKRGQVVLSEMWAEKLAPQNTWVAAMHPGWAGTPGVERSLPRFWRRMQNRLRAPAEGADTIVWLAVSAVEEQSTGLFWFDRQPAPTHLAWWTKEKPSERKRLWETCRERGGV